MAESSPRTLPLGALLLCSAVLVVLHPPGWGTHFIGMVAYVPFLLALEQQFRRQSLSLGKKIATGFLYALVPGVLTAALGLDWVASSIHAFGGLPLPLAYLAAGFSYGIELALIFFVGFALPLLVIRTTNGWDLPVRALWMLMVDLLYPRLVQWSFGSATLSQVPLLEQAADLVGAWGLGLLAIAANLLVAAAIRVYLLRDSLDRRVLRWNIAIWCLSLVCLLGYGTFRIQTLDDPQSAPSLDLVSVQPNFSLQHLAANANEDAPERQFSLEALLDDSIEGLAVLPSDSGHQRLLIWPESAFPGFFLQEPKVDASIKALTKKYRTSLLFSAPVRSVSEGKYINQGLSVLVDPTGEVTGSYAKITLMPFGEYIPGEHAFPWLGRAVRSVFPIISEFSAGETHNIFNLPGGYPISGIICFDVIAPEVPRRMAKNGAGLIINLANLAWFGRSKASGQMATMARWRAIENRVPVMISAMNGETLLIGARGEIQGDRLPLFTKAIWTGTVQFVHRYSFYREHASSVQLAFGILLILALMLAHFRGRIFRS